ncbi:hypothetical protein Ddye_032068 [Dipteronia dyeriana]|uniref:SWIM-type domain-containing protein n=1 Tax=Dipteronia dyeriana TaxID=168575 RepID=A0AAD9WN56_9ROSI|nr:hypothetical protein Ddye_032068 [Dipteronia dyeriana]
MKNVHLVLNWGGEWKSHHGEYWYEGRRAKAFAFSRDSNYDQLLDKVYNVTGIDKDHYRVSMTTLPQTFSPSMPIKIVDDEDVQLLLSRENVDPLVCISVEEIGHQSPEMKHNPPESSHNLHHVTMDEFRRSDVPNMAAHLDDIREGLQSPPRHFSFQDTTGNQQNPEHDETEPQFNFSREGVPNQYDEQFANVQRLVPPPCAFYSINSGEVAPRPVTMRLEVAKVHNSDYFQIRKFDNKHTCSTEARFPHQRQASARVIGEQIQEKFRDHRLYKPKEIIHDMQREFGISCNYHKGYRARHIALEEVQGTPVASYIHLERNMVGHYGRNKALKQYFRLVARVYRESQFIQHMEQLANINPEAAQYVTNIGIEPADVAIGVKDDKARYMRIYPITFYTFLVKDGGLDVHVDLIAKTCTCKEFDVDQIPCAHALGCIRLRGFSFVDYCSPYYSSVFLVAAYSGEIHLVGQPSEWLVPEDIVSKIVHPSVGRCGLGRSKKNRIPSFGKEVTQRSCTTCHRVGHNSHTCTYPKASRPSSGMGSISEIGEASRSHDVVE